MVHWQEDGYFVRCCFPQYFFGEADFIGFDRGSADFNAYLRNVFPRRSEDC
jgi:hypothetical protein